MKTKTFIASSLFFLLFVSTSLQSQTKRFHIRPTFTVRVELTGYTFFTGGDATDFRTSIKGFGSGLLDFWNDRTSIELVAIGSDQVYVSTGFGLAVNKYRLSNHILFNLNRATGSASWQIDPDPTHDYVDTFWGYGKTKLVQASLFFPLYLNVRSGPNMQVTGGGFVEFPFLSKFKMKYIQDGTKMKDLIPPMDMKDFHFSPIKFGLHAGIFHKKWGIGIGASYYLSPLFMDGLGPDLNECRLSFRYSIKDFKGAWDLMKRDREDRKK